LSDLSEAVLGEIPVSAKLALGSERLRLFVTSTRIIVARVGKRGAGAVATTSLFGRLSGALEDFFKSGRESLGARGMEGLTPDEILASNKDNFYIRVGDVVSVNVVKMGSRSWLTLVTVSEKLEFLTSQEFLKVVELLETILGGKVSSSLF
jgi:hypothetical protein